MEDFLAFLGTPAFRLYILRHARAAWAQPGQSDFERALDDDGHLRNVLQMNGASRTGRWAGRVYQPQNLPPLTMTVKKM